MGAKRPLRRPLDGGVRRRATGAPWAGRDVSPSNMTGEGEEETVDHGDRPWAAKKTWTVSRHCAGCCANQSWLSSRNAGKARNAP